MLKKIRQTLKKKGGFSLIELLVVIAIMGVIALVAIPNVVSALDTSKKNTDKVNASAIATAITTAKANGKTVSDATDYKAFTKANFGTVIPDYLQSAPTVKFTGTDGASTGDVSFYVIVSDKGEVTVYAKTVDSTTDTYVQIFPTPAAPWDK